jgi:hypothetical protein
MGMPTSEEGWVDVYETVDFGGDPGFEKSGKRGDGRGRRHGQQRLF